MSRTIVVDAEDFAILSARVDLSRFEGRLSIERDHEGHDEVALTADDDTLRELNAHLAAVSFVDAAVEPELSAAYEGFMLTLPEELYDEHDAADDLEAVLPLYAR